MSEILVTGVPRSGASIIAGAIKECGIFSGGVNKMNENYNIRTMVNSYFNCIGIDARGQKTLPDTNNILIPNYWKDNVLDILKKEGCNDNWMYKDSKSCLIWPIWDYAFPKAKWVIVRRRTGDIVQSCLKTSYMNAHQDEAGWINWVHEYEERFKDMIERVNYKVIWPERMVNSDYGQLKDLCEWIGIEYDENKIKRYIEPLLWKSRKKQ